jgi:phosphate transport system substrate-binding protein
MLCACDEKAADTRACVKQMARPDGLVAAGSGASIPLFRRLADNYRGLNGVEVVVPESIGTGGAVRALRDGAIDLGLATRPLKARERRGDIVETPLARTALAVAVRRDTAVGRLDRDLVRRVFSGKQKRWSDGRAIIPLQREQGDSGWQIISKADPGLFEAIQKGRALKYQRYCYTDGEVFDTLAQVQGSVGIVDEGVMRLRDAPFRWTALGDVKRVLFVLSRKDSSADVARFLGYLQSDEVARFLVGHGYEPLMEPGASHAD